GRPRPRGGHGAPAVRCPLPGPRAAPPSGVRSVQATAGRCAPLRRAVASPARPVRGYVRPEPGCFFSGTPPPPRPALLPAHPGGRTSAGLTGARARRRGRRCGGPAPGAGPPVPAPPPGPGLRVLFPEEHRARPGRAGGPSAGLPGLRARRGDGPCRVAGRAGGPAGTGARVDPADGRAAAEGRTRSGGSGRGPAAPGAGDRFSERSPMSIRLEHRFTVPVPVEEAWDVLLDVERVAPCMPGATLES